MNDVLVYKDYTRSVHFSADEEVFFGKFDEGNVFKPVHSKSG